MLVYGGCSGVWDPAVDVSMTNPISEGDACHEEKCVGDGEGTESSVREHESRDGLKSFTVCISNDVE